DFGEMRAVRIGAGRAVEARACIELQGIDAWALGEIGKADRAVGAGDAHGAVTDLEVADTGFQRLRGDLLQLVAKIMRCLLHADATARDRGRAAGAETRRDLVGVTLQDMHALRWQAELIGDELRIGSLMPLPARLRADQDGDVAIGIERDL